MNFYYTKLYCTFTVRVGSSIFLTVDKKLLLFYLFNNNMLSGSQKLIISHVLNQRMFSIHTFSVKFFVPGFLFPNTSNTEPKQDTSQYFTDSLSNEDGVTCLFSIPSVLHFSFPSLDLQYYTLHRG